MRTSFLIPLLSVFLFSSLDAQDLKYIQKQFQLIPGGTYTSGGGYQFEVNQANMMYLGFDGSYADLNKGQVAIGEVPHSNNPGKKSTVNSFYLSQKEVTNLDYREFLQYAVLDAAEREEFTEQMRNFRKNDPGQVYTHWQTLFAKADAQGLMPDTACWSTNFVYAYNKPLERTYLWHPAFNSYPVVGVSWSQANAYCEWLTALVNDARQAKGLDAQPPFRLPTEEEWEYAASGGQDFNKTNYPVYPWEGSRVWDDKGMFLANIKADHRNYIGDNFEYTAPVASYAPGNFGLYDMAGNVSEWTQNSFEVRTFSEDSPIQVAPQQGATSGIAYRVVKGGSWADYRYAAEIGSRCRMDESAGHARVGFRIARSK